MSRSRKFPLISLLVLLALGFALYNICLNDASTPQRALFQVKMACEQVANSLRMIAGATAETQFVFTETLPEDDITQVEMPILVNEAFPLPEGYKTENLVRMRDYCDSSVVYIKGSEIDGEKVAVDALMTMLRAAIAEGVSNWQISAGYRSIAYQQKVWDNKVYEYRQEGLSASKARQATAKVVAKPGCSEHHTGLAFDVTVPGESFPTTKQSKWLGENCYKYGFIIRYPEDKTSITGILREPWHIRYVGQPHAQIMHDNNWCLEEYWGVADQASGNIQGAPAGSPPK